MAQATHTITQIVTISIDRLTCSCKKIDAIANEFKGQEVEVLQYLCKKYKVATSKVAGLDEAILLKATAKKQVIEEKVDESDTTTNTEITEETND